MSSLYRREDDEELDSEITLSTGSLLALFLGLVLVCGVFFGFGYSVGRRAPANAAIRAGANDGEGTGGDTPAALAQTPAQPFSSTDPAVQEGYPSDSSSPALTGASSSAASSALSPAADGTSPGGLTPALDKAQPAASMEPSDTSSAAPAATPATTAAGQLAAPPVARPEPAPKLQPAAIASLPVKMTTARPQTSPMVQVAAVVRQEDADVLVAALRKRGYNAVVRTEPQDKFLHVQVGPFADRVQANAMRQKLFSDGYNAIIK